MMVNIEIKNVDGNTIVPFAGSEKAAGYDIIAISDPNVVGEVANTREIGGKVVTFYTRIDYIEYKTGIFISPQPRYLVDSETKKIINTLSEYHTLCLPRSSVRKYDLVLANSIGLIDGDYRGEITFCFKYIFQPESLAMETVPVPSLDGSANVTYEMTGRMLGVVNYEKIYKKGDKIGQLVADETNPIKFNLVTELDSTNRGTNGYGSTDNIKIGSKASDDEGTVEGTLSAFKSVIKGAPSPLVDLYNKAGGVQVKKRYSQEIKERNQK